MLNRRRQIAGLFTSGSRLRSQTGRVLSGLVLAASPHVADAVRKGDRRAGNHERKNDDAGNNRDTSEQGDQSATKSDQRNDGRAGTETRDSSAKSDNAGKRDRTESTGDNNDGREHRLADSGNTRGGSQRNVESNSDSSDLSAEDDDSQQQSGRHVRVFEQRAAEPTGDSPPDSLPLNDALDATATTPANPNVAIDVVPSSPIADLVVDANDDVVASVSTSGGFAFARSGDVIAVSGPDGASIIRTGDVSTGTIGTTPAEPSDEGGNNDVDFSS